MAKKKSKKNQKAEKPVLDVVETPLTTEEPAIEPSTESQPPVEAAVDHKPEDQPPQSSPATAETNELTPAEEESTATSSVPISQPLQTTSDEDEQPSKPQPEEPVNGVEATKPTIVVEAPEQEAPIAVAPEPDQEGSMGASGLKVQVEPVEEGESDYLTAPETPVKGAPLPESNGVPAEPEEAAEEPSIPETTDNEPPVSEEQPPAPEVPSESQEASAEDDFAFIPKKENAKQRRARQAREKTEREEQEVLEQEKLEEERLEQERKDEEEKQAEEQVRLQQEAAEQAQREAEAAEQKKLEEEAAEVAEAAEAAEQKKLEEEAAEAAEQKKLEEEAAAAAAAAEAAEAAEAEERRQREEEERLEQEKLEQEKLEQERLEQERLEQEAQEAAAEAEAEAAAAEAAEAEEKKQREEQERLEQEEREAAEAAAAEEKRQLEEQEKLEQERLEQERVEQERLEQERLEQERVEQERLEQEQLEQERLEQERLEQERIEQEAREAAAAAEAAEAEELRQREEQERLEQEAREAAEAEARRQQEEQEAREAAEAEERKQQEEQERIEQERRERELAEEEERLRQEAEAEAAEAAQKAAEAEEQRRMEEEEAIRVAEAAQKEAEEAKAAQLAAEQQSTRVLSPEALTRSPAAPDASEFNAAPKRSSKSTRASSESPISGGAPSPPIHAPRPHAITKLMEHSRPPAPSPPVGKMRARRPSALDSDSDESVLVQPRRAFRGGEARGDSRGSTYPPQPPHPRGFASRVPVEPSYNNGPPPPPPGYHHSRNYPPAAPPYYQHGHSMSQPNYPNSYPYAPPSHAPSSPYSESWSQYPPSYPPYGAPPQRHDSSSSRDYPMHAIENGPGPESGDVFSRIAQTIPDLHVLLAQYKETHSQLSVREELLRRASVEQEEKLRAKDDEIDDMKEKVRFLEGKHSAEASRLRFQIGNLEEQVKEYREQIAETEKFKKEAEETKIALDAALKSWETKYKDLAEAHITLERTAAEEKAQTWKDFEDWKTSTSTKHDAEKIALAIQFDKRLKEADVLADKQRQEATAVFVQEKEELRSDHQRQQRERENSFDRVRNELETKLNSAQKDREEALKHERESREFWVAEREMLLKSHQEDHDNLKKGWEEQRTFMEAQHKKTKDESDKAWIELHADASRKADEEKAKVDQLVKEREDLVKQHNALKAESQKERDIIRSVATNLESEKTRLEKLMECYGDIAEIKGKGDTYYLVSFSQLQKQIIDLAATHFVHLPVRPPPEELAQVPSNLPSFLGDTLASRQVRAAYVAHTVSKLITYRVFGPFLFSLGRRFDKADSLFLSMSNHIRDKSTRKEAIWRQQTLLAAFTSSGAKQRINTAAGTVVEEIVNAIKHFADPKEEEGIKIAVKRIVKLAAETWRFARLEREMIVAEMPALQDEEHHFTGQEYWPAYKSEGTVIGSLLGASELGDGQPQILLRLFPVIYREAKHENFHGDGEERDEGCIYHHGLALYDDAEAVVTRAEELKSAGLPPFTTANSPTTSIADGSGKLLPHVVPPPPQDPPPSHPEPAPSAPEIAEAPSVRAVSRSSQALPNEAASVRARSTTPPTSPIEEVPTAPVEPAVSKAPSIAPTEKSETAPASKAASTRSLSPASAADETASYTRPPPGPIEFAPPRSLVEAPVADEDGDASQAPGSVVASERPKSVAASQPAESEAAPQPADSVAASEPAKGVAPSQPAESVVASQPAGSVAASLPAESVAASQPAESVAPPQPSRPASVSRAPSIMESIISACPTRPPPSPPTMAAADLTEDVSRRTSTIQEGNRDLPTPPHSRSGTPPRPVSPLFEAVDEIDALQSHRSRSTLMSQARRRSSHIRRSTDTTEHDMPEVNPRSETVRRTSGYALSGRTSKTVDTERTERTSKTTDGERSERDSKSRYMCESRSAAVKGLYPNSPLAGQTANTSSSRSSVKSEKKKDRDSKDSTTSSRRDSTRDSKDLKRDSSASNGTWDTSSQSRASAETAATHSSRVDAPYPSELRA